MNSNSLDGVQKYKLCKWIDENRSGLLRLSQVTVANRATRALGFNVTQSNIRSAFLSVGVSTEKSRTGDSGKSLHRKIRTVARALERLLDEVGADKDSYRELLLVCERKESD